MRRRMEDDEARLRELARERERMRDAFMRSDAGEARVAFEQGDQVFQCSFDVIDTRPVVVPMVTATTSSTSSIAIGHLAWL